MARNTENYSETDVGTLEDPRSIDWAQVDYKDLDRVREMIGYDKDELDPIVDDLVVRDMAGAIKDAQLIGGEQAMRDLPQALEDRREALAIVKEVWDNRAETTTTKWDPPNDPEGKLLATRELHNDMISISRWFDKTWTGENGPKVDIARGVIERAASDGIDSLDRAIQMGRMPTDRAIPRMELLEGFKARYETERDAIAASGNETENSKAAEFDLNTQEGFERAVGINNGEVDEVVAESARNAWQDDLKAAASKGDEAWDQKVAQIKQDIEMVRDDGTTQPRVEFPEGPLDKETLDRASERLDQLKGGFIGTWQEPSLDKRLTDGRQTIDQLLKAAESRIETAQEAIAGGNEVADVSKDAIATAMIALESAANKYRAFREDPEAYRRQRETPETETGEARGERDTNGNRPETETKTSSEGGTSGDREQVRGNQESDERTSRGIRQEIFSSEADGGPGARDKWTTYHNEMYYGLRVRNKRAAEAFREGTLLSTDGWLRKARQEADVRAVAATLSDRTRWTGQEERQERSEAAAFQMLARESFRQEERKAEKAYENWVPNRPEMMTREQLWDVLNEDERDYFRGVFQQVAKQLEMAADPSVKWSNKDAAKAIKSIMKAAEQFTLDQGITDKRGYMLRTPRPRVIAGEGEEGTNPEGDGRENRDNNRDDGAASENNRETERRQRNAETGNEQNNEQPERKAKQNRWDFDTVSDAIAEKDGPAGMEYLKRLIADELTGGRAAQGAQEVYADVLTEKYREDLYESSGPEKDEARFARLLAEMRGEMLLLQGGRSMADEPQITKETLDQWGPDGPITRGLRESMETAPEGDLKQMQREVLDRMEELAQLQGGEPEALQQLNNYAMAAQALDVTLRTERDNAAWMSEVLEQSTKEDHPMLRNTVSREMFKSKVMGERDDDSEDMKLLSDVAWRAYGPVIEQARREGAADLMIAAIRDAGQDAQYLRTIDERFLQKMKSEGSQEEQRVATLEDFNAMKTEMDGIEQNLKDIMAAGGSDKITLGDPKDGLSPMGARLIQEQLHREIRAAMEPGELQGDFKVSDTAVQAKSLAVRLARHQSMGRPG